MHRPSPPSRLLVVALQRFGHVVVHDKPNVGLVDAHAKRDGRHNHIHVLHQELILDPAARVAVHSCMVWKRLHAIDTQGLCNLLHPFAAQTIHDAALAHVLERVPHDLFEGILLGSDLVEQIVSVER